MSTCASVGALLEGGGFEVTGLGVDVLPEKFVTAIQEKEVQILGLCVTLVGNIPPRDVLAAGTPEDVQRAVTDLLESLDDFTRLIVSCGGDMPPDAPTESIQALISTVQEH